MCAVRLYCRILMGRFFDRVMLLTPVLDDTRQHHCVAPLAMGCPENSAASTYSNFWGFFFYTQSRHVNCVSSTENHIRR
jgi:hypothetical protein